MSNGHTLPDNKDCQAQIAALHQRIAELEQTAANQQQELEALRLREERYRLAADTTFDWTYWIEPGGKLHYVSPSCERVTGYRAEEFQADPALLERILHPDDRSEVLEHLRHELDCQHTREMQFRIITRSGEVRWIGHVCQPVRSAEGRCMGQRASNRDITAWKQAEEMMHTTHQRLDRLFSNIHFSIAYLDRDMNFLCVNQAYAAADNREPDFFVGKNHFDLYPHAENEAIFRRVVETGEPYTVYARPFVYPANPERGITYWDWTLQPVRDASGQVEGLVFCLSDVTERVRLQETYQTVVENSLQGLMIFQDERTVFANSAAARIVGYSPDEMMAMSPEDHWATLHPDDRDMVVQRARDRLAGKEAPNHYTFRMLRKDGAVRWLEAFVTRISYRGRPATQMVYLDITERRQAEEALHERETLLRSINDNLSDGMLYQYIEPSDSHTGWYTYVSGGIEPLYGITPEQLYADAALRLSLIHPEDQGRFEEAKAVSRRMLTPLDIEVRRCSQQDSQHWSHLRAFPRRLEDGHIVWDGFEIDITGRKQAEETLQMQEYMLQASELKFRSFFEQSQDGLMLVDEQGTLIEWSRNAEWLFGLRQDEVLGRYYWDVLYQVAPQEHRNPQIYERLKARVQQFIAQARSDSPTRWTGERLQRTLQRPDGTRRSVSAQVFPIQANGQLLLGGIVRDVTDQVAAAESLQASEARYRALFEGSLNPITIYDRDATIVLVNPAGAANFQLSVEEMIGRPLRDFVPEHHEMTMERVRQVLATNEPLSLEDFVALPDGGRWFWTLMQPTTVADGLRNVVQAISYDITERKQAEEALQRQIRYQAALASCSQTLLQTASDSEEQQAILTEALEHLREGAQVSRVYLFQNFYDPEKGFSSGMLVEVHLPGFGPLMSHPLSQAIPWASVPEEHRRTLEEGRPLGGMTADLFADAPELLPILQENSILSTQVFPIHFAGHWWGYIGFDACEQPHIWDDTEIMLLRTAAEMIGQVLQRWQTEDALRESTQQTVNILESITDAFFALDYDFRFTYLNQRAAELLRRGPRELLGKNLWNEFPEAVALAFFEQYHRVMRQRVPANFVAFFPPLDTWFEVHAYPSRDGMSVYFQNINERKRAEEALRESEGRLQAALYGSNDGIWDWDYPSGKVYFSDRWLEMLGYERSDIVGHVSSWEKLVHPDDMPHVQEDLQAHLEGRSEVYSNEHRCRTKDGSWKWILDRGRVFTRDQAGQPLRVVGTHSDITDRKRMEEALRESEERYRLLADNASDMISRHTPEGVYLYASPASLPMLGYAPDELIGRYAYELFHPDDIVAIQESHSTVLEMPLVYTVSYRIQRKDGSYIWFETTNQSVRESESGSVTEIIAVSRDINERKQAEEALRESEARYRRLSENAPDLIYRIRFLPTRGFEYVSPISTEMIGYTPEDHYADPDLGYKLVYSEDLPLLDAISRGEQPLEAPLEIRWMSKEGDIIWVEQRNVPIYDEAGNLVAIEGIARDITERRQMEAALRESEEMFRTLVASMDDIVFTLDREQRHTGIYGHWLERYGLKAEFFLGKTSRETSPSEELAAIHEEANSRALKGEYVSYFWQMGDPPTYVQTSLSPMRDVRGEVVGLVGVGRDVTIIKQSEVALQRAKEAAESASLAKSTFLANMSHELRTPLNAILGFTQLMEYDERFPSDMKDDLHIVTKSGEHLLSLINDILDMSKIEAGRIVLQEQEFDLHSILHDITSMFELRASEKGLQLLLEQAPDVPPFVRADEKKLRQVLMNLLSNAIKFTYEGGVTLRIRKQAPESSGTEDDAAGSVPTLQRSNAPMLLYFEVEDTGIGIDPENLQSIFDAFTQVPEKSRHQEGTGLGLPISQHFVQMMGGTLTVQSEPERGTRFSFKIPVQVAAPLQREPERPPRRVTGLAPGQPTYRILVVEDRVESRVLLMQLLHPLGFDVDEAANGREAVELCDSWEPHMIFMDMRMPVMDGYEATRQIRASTRGQAVAIVALTASAFEEDRNLILSAGCDAFIRKPFRRHEIFDVLHSLLGVEFLYAEPEPSKDNAPTSTQETAPPAPALTAETLAELPPDWVMQVHRAALIGNGRKIHDLTEQIRDQYPRLSKQVQGLAQEFHFGEILSVTSMLVEQQDHEDGTQKGI